jgi:hypothetical protein
MRRQLRVRGTQKPEIELEQLARALLRAAQEKAEAARTQRAREPEASHDQ